MRDDCSTAAEKLAGISCTIQDFHRRAISQFYKPKNAEVHSVGKTFISIVKKHYLKPLGFLTSKIFCFYGTEILKLSHSPLTFSPVTAPKFLFKITDAVTTEFLLMLR